ncbi:MAG: 2,3-bisphosphoglycerate-independent phosphoglycerate mutase [Bacteroidota bacterium]
MNNQRSILIILDGWGIGTHPEADAIAQASTPFVDQLLDQYPHSNLVTFGEEVGLPEGQMGNSEVGHMNLGAGRIVYQELARINKAIRDRELQQNPVLLRAIEQAKSSGKNLHLLGLISDGGVHSHINHLKALCDILEEQGVERSFMHLFTDGRDTDPKGGQHYITDLLNHTAQQKVELASLIGRYFAMDRDNRWERVKEAYDLLVRGKGLPTSNPVTTIQAQYEAGKTDEFLPAIFCSDANGHPKAIIQNGDIVIFFNFRTDRPRELTQVLSQENMPDHDMQKLDLHYVTMTRYDETYQGVEVLFQKKDIERTLGEVLANAGKTQVRIAETEKYPHVTFFFSGGREEAFAGERRILIPSPKVATYDLQPEMSADAITEAIVKDIKDHTPDFICLNYANTDMVGHTGDFKAAMKAAETVDRCLKDLVETCLEYDYHAFIIADHGNSDYMINEDGTPNTAHTKNLVPCIYVSKGPAGNSLQDGKLADLAPTILQIMGIPSPPDMDGRSLISYT